MPQVHNEHTIFTIKTKNSLTPVPIIISLDMTENMVILLEITHPSQTLEMIRYSG